MITTFEKIVIWLRDERNKHQIKKFDYTTEDSRHIREGLQKGSYLDMQVKKYIARVAYPGALKTSSGRQAYMKLVATLVAFGEAMIEEYGEPPYPGVKSGVIKGWDYSKRVYLSGPMTGVSKKNKPEFDRTENLVQGAGFIPVSPFLKEEEQNGKDLTWEDYMQLDMHDLISCEHILMLPNWKESRGATTEKALAEVLGIEVHYDVESLIG